MEYYLGIDWGEKKCGIALADKETQMAWGWKLCFLKDLEKELVDLKKKFFLKKIILGISQGYLYSDKNKKNILNFQKKLERLGFQVFLQEEFFSTRLAKNNLREKKGGKKSTEKDDVEAARLILQSWLDKKK